MNERDLRTALRLGRLPTRPTDRWRAFELSAGFTLSVARAYPRYWSSSPPASNPPGVWTTLVDPELEFEVVDPLYPMRLGRYRGQFAAPNDQGSVGIARWSAEAAIWEIIELQPHATLIIGTLTWIGPQRGLWPYTIMQPTGAIMVDYPGQPVPLETDAHCDNCIRTQHIAALGGTLGGWTLIA